MSTTISPQDVAARIGLDPKELDKSCDESYLPSLAVFVHPHRLVFSHLLSPVDLDDAESENVGRSGEEKRLGCLRKWKARHGSEATFKVIVQAVLLSGYVDNAEAICRQLLLRGTELLQEHAIVQSQSSTDTPERSGQPHTEIGLAMISSNEDNIKALFSSLLLDVRKALQMHEVDIDDVRQFLVTFFKQDLIHTQDFNKIFEAVTIRGLWDHHNYGAVEKLTNRFLPHNLSVKSLMRDYKAQLSGFHMAEKLIDFIEYRKLHKEVSDEESDQVKIKKLTTAQYRKIKVVLKLERKISELSLDYVYDLWESIAVEYDLPSLTAILDKIVAGSLEITWLVPVHVAQLLIIPRPKFYKKQRITQVFIDDVIIYDEKQMAGYEQKFLKLCRNAAKADVNQFSYFLRQGVDPDITDEEGYHPLLYVSFYGRRDLVELLLQHHATVDLATKDDVGHTALTVTCQSGSAEVAQILIKAGAKVNYCIKYRESALWKASYRGHRDIVQLLLQHGAEVDLPNNGDRGETALFAASQEGRLETATLLLNSGAVVNYQNKQGNTPLYFASKNGHIDVVELLLAGGADINKGPQSPVYAATQHGNMDTVKLLVQRGADVDRPCDDECGATPLITACDMNHPQVVQYLLDNGADINMQNKVFDCLHC